MMTAGGFGIAFLFSGLAVCSLAKAEFGERKSFATSNVQHAQVVENFKGAMNDRYLQSDTCSNGITGVEESDVCCVLECGTCGGWRCRSRGRATGLSRSDCCPREIQRSGALCSSAGAAPCIIDDEPSTASPAPSPPTPSPTTPFPTTPSPPTPTPSPATPSPITPSSPTPSPTSPSPPTPSPFTPSPPTPSPITPSPPTSSPITPSPPTPAPITPSPPTSSPITPSPLTPSPTLGTISDDMQTLLDLHNVARCEHNADPLVYSETVQATAQAYAEVLTSDCGTFEHSDAEDRDNYGENLYMCWRIADCFTPENAMIQLYDEEVQTDDVLTYGGHATQILWKSTTELGCAVESCTLNGVPYEVLVCHYNPAGNVIGQYLDEVELPSGASC